MPELSVRRRIPVRAEDVGSKRELLSRSELRCQTPFYDLPITPLLHEVI